MSRRDKKRKGESVLSKNAFSLPSLLRESYRQQPDFLAVFFAVFLAEVFFLAGFFAAIATSFLGLVSFRARLRRKLDKT